MERELVDVADGAIADRLVRGRVGEVRVQEAQAPPAIELRPADGDDACARVAAVLGSRGCENGAMGMRLQCFAAPTATAVPLR